MDQAKDRGEPSQPKALVRVIYKARGRGTARGFALRLVQFGASLLLLARLGGGSGSTLCGQQDGLWQRGFLFPIGVRGRRRAVRPREGHRPAGSQLMLLCSPHVVPAAKLANCPAKWLFGKEIYGLKWRLPPPRSAIKPSSSGGEQL